MKVGRYCAKQLSVLYKAAVLEWARTQARLLVDMKRCGLSFRAITAELTALRRGDAVR